RRVCARCSTRRDRPAREAIERAAGQSAFHRVVNIGIPDDPEARAINSATRPSGDHAMPTPSTSSKLRQVTAPHNTATPVVRAIDVGFGLVKLTVGEGDGVAIVHFPSMAIPADASA